MPKPHAAPIPPTLLLAICDALRDDDNTDGPVRPLLPLVLSKLRAWRLLHRTVQCTPEALHALALELREAALNITPTALDASRLAAAPKLRSRGEWPRSTKGRARSDPTFDLARSAHSKIGHSPSTHRPHRRTASAEYRSGCAACRRLRDPSLPQTPVTEVLSTTDTLSPLIAKCKRVTPAMPQSVPSREKARGKNISIPSLRKRQGVDSENTPLLPPAPSGVKSAITFPPQNTPWAPPSSDSSTPRMLACRLSSPAPLGKVLRTGDISNRERRATAGSVDRQCHFVHAKAAASDADQPSSKGCQSRAPNSSATRSGMGRRQSRANEWPLILNVSTGRSPAHTRCSSTSRLPATGMGGVRSLMPR